VTGLHWAREAAVAIAIANGSSGMVWRNGRAVNAKCTSIWFANVHNHIRQPLLDWSLFLLTCCAVVGSHSCSCPPGNLRHQRPPDVGQAEAAAFCDVHFTRKSRYFLTVDAFSMTDALRSSVAFLSRTSSVNARQQTVKAQHRYSPLQKCSPSSRFHTRLASASGNTGDARADSAGVMPASLRAFANDESAAHASEGMPGLTREFLCVQRDAGSHRSPTATTVNRHLGILVMLLTVCADCALIS